MKQTIRLGVCSPSTYRDSGCGLKTRRVLRLRDKEKGFRSLNGTHSLSAADRRKNGYHVARLNPLGHFGVLPIDQWKRRLIFGDIEMLEKIPESKTLRQVHGAFLEPALAQPGEQPNVNLHGDSPIVVI